jgi:hypothetical protein
MSHATEGDMIWSSGSQTKRKEGSSGTVFQICGGQVSDGSTTTNLTRGEMSFVCSFVSLSRDRLDLIVYGLFGSHFINHRHSAASHSLFLVAHKRGVDNLIYDTVCLSRHFVVPVRLLPFSHRTKNSLSQTIIIIIIIIIIMNLINIKHVCFLENNLFWKVNSEKINFRKVNYFLIFDNIIKNKLENIFQCLVMSWKMRWKIMY